MENTIYSINGPVVTIKGKTDLEMMERSMSARHALSARSSA